MESGSEITAHYGRVALVAELSAALGEADYDTEALPAESVAGFEELHLGGRAATLAVIESLGLESKDAVLDVGCGVGGAARVMARTVHCSVTGVDLTPEFVDTARWLTDRLGIGDGLEFQVGSALDLPFEDGSFDVVTMLHVGMNIADKPALMRELARVLVPEGRLAAYDVMRTSKGELEYPVPWASVESSSFLSTPEEYGAAIVAAGLSVVATDDRRQLVADAFEAARRSPAAVGPCCLMGEGWPIMVANLVRAFRSGMVTPIQILAVK